MWGAQTSEPKSKAGLRTDDNGSLLWGAQTKKAKDGTKDEDSRHEGEVFTGTRKFGLRGAKK